MLWRMHTLQGCRFLTVKYFNFSKKRGSAVFEFAGIRMFINNTWNNKHPAKFGDRCPRKRRSSPRMVEERTDNSEQQRPKFLWRCGKQP